MVVKALEKTDLRLSLELKKSDPSPDVLEEDMAKRGPRSASGRYSSPVQ
jgi:hypothetical protein